MRLDRETAELDARLERRVRAMVDGGFLDEVRALDAAGIRHGLTASRALGYRQMLAVLDGTLALEQAIVDDGGRDPALRPAAAQLVPPGLPDGRPRRRGARDGGPGARPAQRRIADRWPGHRRRPAGPVCARNLEP